MNSNNAPWRTSRLALAGCASLLVALSGCSLANTAPETNAQSSTTSSGVAEVKEIADLLPEKYKTSGKITVGSATGLAPMMFIDDDGRTISGVEADLMRDVGQVLGTEIHLEDVKPEAFMTGVLAQRFDVAAGSITYTKERKAQADFVVYAHYGQALAKAAGNEEEITFDTLCGKTVAVLNGSVQQTRFLPELSDKCVAAGNPAIVGDAFPDANSLFLAVQSNRAAAAFLNEVSVLYQVEQSKGKMEVADSGLGSDPKGLVIGRDTGLQDALTAAVKHLADTGRMKEIFAKWNLEEVLDSDVQLNPDEV